VTCAGYESQWHISQNTLHEWARHDVVCALYKLGTG